METQGERFSERETFCSQLHKELSHTTDPTEQLAVHFKEYS